MSEKKPGSLLVLTAPSGTGKSTVAKKLIERHAGLHFSVSCTTRKSRKGEKDGREYHFISPVRFRGMAKRGEMAEWAPVHGALYGTPKKALETELRAGQSVLMDIDPEGALQIRKAFPKESVLILLLPPSWESLEKRLIKRADMTEATRRRRMQEAAGILRHWRRFDYVVINARLSTCISDLGAIVRAEALKTHRCQEALAPLVERLRKQSKNC